MSIYNYFSNYCVCPGRDVYLGMRDLYGNEASSFPVFVYNVNEELIGEALNKQQYIDIWNTDPDNRLVGTLSGLIGPFSFTLTLKPGQSAPAFVIGDQYGAVPENSIIDSDGDYLVDSDGDYILFQ